MLRVYLTGDLCLTADDIVVTARALPGRQGRLALTYLVAERANPVSRDHLAEALWPQRLPLGYEVALSAIVSKLRRMLDGIGVGRARLVAVDGCWHLQLPPGSWVDVEAAKESVHLGEAALLASDPRGAYGHAVVAAAILRRPLLPGAEGSWIDGWRASLRRLHLRALECLAQVHAWNGELALALRAADEAVALEPYREMGYRRLMLLHGQAGNRAEAMRAYERLRNLLATELNTAPASEIRSLYESIAAADPARL